jgi:asparagine synthase (glutamine-hydrolysing)
MGFDAPMAEWMRGPFGAQVAATLTSSRLFDRLPFDRGHVRHLIDEHRSGRRDYARLLWTLFNLAAWYDYWVDGSRVARSARPARAMATSPGLLTGGVGHHET